MLKWTKEKWNVILSMAELRNILNKIIHFHKCRTNECRVKMGEKERDLGNVGCFVGSFYSIERIWPFGRREYLRLSSSPTSSMAAKALSSISLSCEALRQKRTRDSVRRVAGKPTVTTAMPRFNISWLKALKRRDLIIVCFRKGWGCPLSDRAFKPIINLKRGLYQVSELFHWKIQIPELIWTHYFATQKWRKLTI